MFPSSPWIRLFLSCAIAFAFAPSLATAQRNPYATLPDLDPPDLEITYALGFGNTIWQDAATPIGFQIKNPSSEFFSGVIEIKTNRYYPEIHRLPIEVGQNSLRRFSLGIVIPSFTDGMEFSIIRDDKIVWRRTLTTTANRIPALSGNSKPPALAVSPGHRPATEGIGGTSLTKFGREILRIAPWQLPDYDSILSPIGGVFFAHDVNFRDIAGPRLTALSRYLAHGGTLLVPKDATAWTEKLLAELPYKISLGEKESTPVGLGLLVRYTGEKSTPPWDRRDLHDFLSTRPSPNYAGYFQSHQWAPYGRGPRSQNSIGAVTIFIVGYLIIAGPLLFFFRRAKRKTVIRLLVILIAFVSVLSIVLGVYLRSSRGDISWTSVTLLGDGGATQTAILYLSSAGGRDHQVDLGIPTAAIDPFDIFPSRHIHPMNYWNSNQSIGEIYQNDLTSPVELGSANIILSPLGEKRIHARGPIPDVQQLEVDAEILLKIPNNRNARSRRYAVKFTIKNPNPFPILNTNFAYFDRKSAGNNNGFLFPTTHSTTLPYIAAGGTIAGEFDLGSSGAFQNYIQNLQGYNPPKSREPRPHLAPNIPRITNFEPENAVLIGTVPASPGFKFSGDFVEAHQRHYLMQYIPVAAPGDNGTTDR